MERGPDASGSRQKSGIAATAMGADAARKQRRKAAAENMKGDLQSAAEAEATAMGEMAGSSRGNVSIAGATTEGDNRRAMERLSAVIERALTGGEV